MDDADEVIRIKGEVNKLVDNEMIKDVDLVTCEIINKADSKLNPGKGDPLFTFTSDYIKCDSVNTKGGC